MVKQLPLTADFRSKVSAGILKSPYRKHHGGAMNLIFKLQKRHDIETIGDFKRALQTHHDAILQEATKKLEMAHEFKPIGTRKQTYEQTLNKLEALYPKDFDALYVCYALQHGIETLEAQKLGRKAA